MSGLPPLTPLVNGTPADASQVDGNFDTLATFVDAELINRDGSVAMTSELTLSSSTPSADLVAASKGYVTAQIDASGRGVMGYAQRTNDLDVGAGGTIDISVSVTFTAVAGRRYRVTFQAPNDEGSVAITTILLREGSTVLAQSYPSAPAGYGVPAIYITNASISGAKTWKLSATVSPASGSIWDFSSLSIAFILVEDIGAL